MAADDIEWARAVSAWNRSVDDWDEACREKGHERPAPTPGRDD